MRQKISSKPKIISLVVAAFVFFGVSSLSAQGVSSISQGFQVGDATIVAGALVGLKGNTPNTVELTNSTTIDQMLGVAGESPLIELNSASGVQVVTSGITATLVSDINGTIKAGDKVTASPIAGVGMKATSSTLIIGTAQADLESAETEARTITDKEGRQRQVRAGLIPVQVDKVFYDAPSDANSFLPPALQDFANGIAGRQVSSIRVLIAAFLVLLLLTVVAVLLYSAVRSSIISIGRNPLSESAVRKSLAQVGLTVVGVLLFTSIVIYLILTL